MPTGLQQTLEKKFAETFGRDPSIVSHAPGRIEVLGNHTDYNEGYVLSAAINCGTFFALAPRDDGLVRLVAGDLMDETGFPAAAPERSDEHSWANYVKGCLAGLNAKFGAPERGFDAMFLGNVPLGSGPRSRWPGSAACRSPPSTSRSSGRRPNTSSPA